ncbi:uncharacterized protein LOC114168864 [Vigna unguiculata]|uniref:uncharacterized protein LOC114168864 n=1 Tax=Vigna unguiculata TaxID=3917 RepID=UPI00101709F9|nr:uncharacterized protein LOC114168864 [Vigna unguiculata]
MVQRIVLGNSKPSFSQHQDGKTRKTDTMKKMMMSRSFQLSDFELSRSSSLSQPRKSPNYMKPTSSSEAKKELFSVSHRHKQSSSDGKSLPQKGMRNSKASFVSCKEHAKSLSRSCSLNSVRTLTKSHSFKPCKACSKKFTSEVMFEDVNAPERATCSSTLKEYNFPEFLTLHPGGTESEGVSVMKVCPYTYCSLNGHGHAPLPPLKSFVSARRHLLETQKKNTNLELVIPQRCDIEQIFFNEKPQFDEAAIGNPTISPLAQEIGMDFLFEIYAKEREGAEEVRKFNTVKEIEKPEDINFAKDENRIAAEEDGVKQVTQGVTLDLLKSQKGDFRNYFTVAAAEVDNKWSFHLGEDVEDAEENHPTSLFHEETCTESYCNVELDEYYSPCWEEQHFREFIYEDTTDSSIFSVEEINSKLESLSERSRDKSEMLLDDIFNSNYADINVEDVRLQEDKEERTICFEAQPHCTDFVLEDTSESIEFLIQEKYYPSKDIDSEYEESTLSKGVFQTLTNEQDNNGENEKHVDYEVSCVSMLLDEEIVENSECHSSSESCKIDESYEDKDASLENDDDDDDDDDDDEFNREHIIHMSKVLEESTTIIIQEQKFSEENEVKSSNLKSTGGEEKHANKNWQWGTKRKRAVEEEEEMRKINPRKPNFLPLVSELEPEKVDLKHQMINERKNAEDWMLDFALRRVVTKLAPAGKRKVSLLVEAFEAVMSMPKGEARIRNDSPFVHARPIQACS